MSQITWVAFIFLMASKLAAQSVGGVGDDGHPPTMDVSYPAQMQTRGGEARSKNMSEIIPNHSACFVSSVPCSCFSTAGICSCATSGCLCRKPPCNIIDKKGTLRATSSSSSTSTSDSTSGSSSSSSSGSTSTSTGTSTGTSTATSCVNCVCTTTTCIDGTCTTSESGTFCG